MSKTQVLVVGAGPTGLVLGAELLARGIETRIVDKGNGVALGTRALGVHARTLEVLDAMGLADAFVDNGQKVRNFHFYTDGTSIARLDMRLNGTRFPYMLDIPQHVTERLLRERLRESGGTVEPDLELVRLEQDAHAACATVRHASGELRTITADYVVGCDGAHSRVRRELGFSFDGHAYDEDWLLADVHMDWNFAEDETHALFRSRGMPMICFPLKDHVWRIVLPYTGERGRRAPVLEEIQELVDQRAPVRVTLSDPTWLANFRCHRRSSHEYRRGRVLLAGDAVHVHSPAGGQGMNTGVMDAHNLAWKLALVASGGAPERLLDTYAEERGPVARQVLQFTHALVRIATEQQPLKRTLRDALLPVASHVPLLQKRIVRRFSNEHVQYRESSLTRANRKPLQSLRPGDRAPDWQVEVNGRRLRLYEALRGGRHVLVMPARGDSRIAELDGSSVLVDVAYDASSRTPWLVRPDGYLAAASMDDICAYLDSIRSRTH